MATARDGESRDRGEARRRSERPRPAEDRTQDVPPSHRGHEDADSESSRRRPRLRASEVAQAALHDIHELTGRQVEGVTSVERSDDGWRVGVEVVESHRVPDTSDVLAVYEADMDPSGELVGYRRAERYTRGRGNER